ncbi:MAG: type II toxin-antitoxin system PemK/MazF family toxin [Butyrivibrio sp.]|nr:type II toxin-antitoxin system PemK/MazF family toxin [Butyrivibrio sp.]
MCKVGDIILVNKYRDEDHDLDKHSFIVLSNENGFVGGLEYNLVCNVMSSFKNEEQRNKKMSYPGNFEITHNDSNVANGNTKDGYIKAEQFYYFERSKLDYKVIGNVTIDFYNELVKFITELEIPIEKIVDNL